MGEWTTASPGSDAYGSLFWVACGDHVLLAEWRAANARYPDRFEIAGAHNARVKWNHRTCEAVRVPRAPKGG